MGKPSGASAMPDDLIERYSASDQTIAIEAGELNAAFSRKDPYLYELNDLREAMGVTGLVAELFKYHGERKRIHEMLTDAGIPSNTPDKPDDPGEPICLIGRVGLAIGRLR